MFIYVVFLCFLYFFSFVNGDKVRSFIFVILLAIMGLRADSVGVDMKNYIDLYTSQYMFDNVFEHSEFGYYLLSQILYSLGLNSQMFVFVLSLFTVFSIDRFIHKYSKNYSLSLLLHITIGLFVVSLSAIRQTLAICIILYSFDYLVDRKFLKFALLVCLASTFHKSAFVFLPFYFYSYFSINSIKKIIVILLSSLIIIYFRYNIAELSGGLILDKYSNSYGINNSNNSLNPILFLINYIIFLSVPIFMILKKKSINNIEEIDSILFSGLSVIILFTGMVMALPMASRLNYYFIFSYIILVPNLIAKFNKFNKFFIISILSVVCLLYFIIGNNGDIMQIDNYKFFFQ